VLKCRGRSQVPIRVVHLDRSGADAGAANHHDFVPEALSGADAATHARPRLHLLYRPGHYDILYCRQAAEASGHTGSSGARASIYPGRRNAQARTLDLNPRCMPWNPIPKP
jgi:Peptidase C65 Otubain